MLCQRSAAREAEKKEHRIRNIKTVLFWWRKFYQFLIRQRFLARKRKVITMRKVNAYPQREFRNGWQRLSFWLRQREICRMKWMDRQERISKELEFARHGTPMTPTLSCKLCRLERRKRNMPNWLTCVPSWRMSMQPGPRLLRPPAASVAFEPGCAQRYSPSFWHAVVAATARETS